MFDIEMFDDITSFAFWHMRMMTIIVGYWSDWMIRVLERMNEKALL
jgi:hypothetical protein